MLALGLLAGSLVASSTFAQTAPAGTPAPVANAVDAASIQALKDIWRTGDGRGEGRRQRFRVSGRGRGITGCLDLQISDKGLALELTAKGTKYYKGSDLN